MMGSSLLLPTANATFAAPGVARAVYYNVRDYGALGDGRVVVDAATTASNTTITSATAAFTAADVGKRATVGVAATTAFASTIASVTNSTAAVLAAAPPTTWSGAELAIGTDAAAAFTAAFTAAAATGGVVVVPAGRYLVATGLVIPGGVCLLGTGIDYVQTPTGPLRGSVLRAGASMAQVVQVGSNQNTYTSGSPSAVLEGVAVDGANLATQAILTYGARSWVRQAQAWRGITYALRHDAQNGYVNDCVLGQDSRGTALFVSGSSGGDNKIYRCQIRGGTAAQAELGGFGGIEFCENHVYANSGDEATAGPNLLIDGSYRFLIAKNVFGNVNLLAPDIKVVAQSGLSPTGPAGVLITGNLFYRTAPTTATTPAILLDTTLTALRCIAVVGNSFYSNAGSAGIGYKSMVDATGGNAVNALNVAGNNGDSVLAFWTNCTPLAHSGNAIRYDPTGTTLNVADTGGGTSTQSGTGSKTAFTIAHGLLGTPGSYTVTAASVAAAAPFYVAADGTNITVNFTTAPASGTNNVVLTWHASL